MPILSLTIRCQMDMEFTNATCRGQKRSVPLENTGCYVQQQSMISKKKRLSLLEGSMEVDDEFSSSICASTSLTPLAQEIQHDRSQEIDKVERWMSDSCELRIPYTSSKMSAYLSPHDHSQNQEYNGSKCPSIITTVSEIPSMGSGCMT